jgi:outer membrane protein assembly factor BamB
MAITQTNTLSSRKPLWLWPGVVIVILQWVVRFVFPVIVPDGMLVGMIGGLVGGLAVVVWWMFFSRAPWSERLGAIALIIVALFATSRIVHESIQNGMMGMMLFISSIPFLSLALVVGAAASHRLSAGPRRAVIAAGILLACGGWTLVRTGGITGDGGSDLHWRWTPTPEERLLAEARDEPKPLLPALAAAETPKEQPAAKTGDAPAALAAVPATPKTEPAAHETATTEPAASAAVATRAAWPGFRGPGRDGIVRGVRVETDWSKSPPNPMWRRPIGPGWSSFAVRGDLLYTQEQRGEDEVVACYKVSTGEPVWRHRDPVRFWESNGGAGPRATPTISGGRVYTFGATGILNALDADNGSVVWSRNATSDSGKKVPEWGRSSSPLVIDDVVIVHAGVLVAYDLATGKRRWFGPARGGSYSSPSLVTIDGVAQVLMLSGDGATSVSPSDGKVLWENEWPGSTIVQPALTPDGDVLITTSSAAGGIGIRRLHVVHGPAGWRVEERWTSTGLKPYFNDFVVHDGHAFGFDGNILSCIDLEDGKRTWKGGRYGNGQLVLLPDQNVLLVLSEDGELALVKATPDQFTEIARFPAALDGKTWNHPVLVGDVLLVRNGQEMAAFRLSLAGS